MKINTLRPVVLCFSGHDPIGGAGIQADIEALYSQKCHTVTVITALTIQDTNNVLDFHVLDPDWVTRQAEAILNDSHISAFKIGMLGSVDIVDAVVKILLRYPNIPVICDPVLSAGGGGSLAKESVAYAIRERLLPLSTIATPNIPESHLLAGIIAEEDIEGCARTLAPFCQWQLITGGHGKKSIVCNYLYNNLGERYKFESRRLPGSYHGSGCTLASALAGRLAIGETVIDAVKAALAYTWITLRDSEKIGRGQSIPKRLISNI